MSFTVKYNAQVISGSGTRLSGSGKPLDEAVETYLNTIKYGGNFSRMRCIDAVQVAEGIVDVVLESVEMDNVAVSNQVFESPSGFFKLDENEGITVNYEPANYEY